jgi:hypothetical protein
MPNPSDIPSAVALEETDYRRPIVEIDDGDTTQVPQQYIGMTVAAEDTNMIAVTGQVYDYQDTLERATELTFYFASDALGTTITTVSGAIAMGASGDIIDVHTAKSSARIVTDADGKFILNVTDTATDTVYLVVCYGDSNKQFIATMPFAA